MPKNRTILIRAFISLAAAVMLFLGVAQASTGVAQASTVKTAASTAVHPHAIPQVKVPEWEEFGTYLSAMACEVVGSQQVEEGNAIAYYCEFNDDECPITYTLWLEVLVDEGGVSGSVTRTAAALPVTRTAAQLSRTSVPAC